MNNPTLSDKDYVSVLPRIIDPKMQFTKESIERTLDTKNAGTVCKMDENTNNDVKNAAVINNTIKEVPLTSAGFFNDYKYVILIVVIVIITIVIIYFIYKYYNNKNKVEVKEEAKEETKEENIEDIKENKEKTENIKAYIYNYIISFE